MMQRLGGVLLAAGIVLGTTTCATSTGATDEDRSGFDLQAHRGGIGLRQESSPAAFEHALELGVTTLELDLQITEDGQAVVTHDRKTNPVICQDTAPAFPGDPEFPYLGKVVKDLTLAQVKTFDCGTRRPPDPTTDRYIDSQIQVPGSKMMTLGEVFDVVKRARATGERGVMLNIETKVEAGAPEQTAPREQFVQVAVEEIRRDGMLGNVTIQSFDWGALMRVRQIEPRLPIVALANGTFLQVGQPGASPWDIAAMNRLSRGKGTSVGRWALTVDGGGSWRAHHRASDQAWETRDAPTARTRPRHSRLLGPV